MNTLAAWLALLTYLAFTYRPFRALLSRLSGRLGEWTVGLLALPYLLATGFAPPAAGLLRLIAFLALPTVWLRLRPRGAKPFDLYHILALLSIWVPVEFDLFTLFIDLIVPGANLRAQLGGLRLLPQADATLLSGVRLPIYTLTAITLALYLFLVYQPVREVGLSFRLRWRDLWRALLGLLGFAVVGVPLGLGTGFLRFEPSTPTLPGLAMGVLGGYLLVALPEELLFRGLIQNLMIQRLGRAWLGLLIAAIIFGLSHLNNGTPGFPVPNWAYVLMATLAGIAYGWVWNGTKKVTASAITHILVNLVWGIAFR